MFKCEQSYGRDRPRPNRIGVPREDRPGQVKKPMSAFNPTPQKRHGASAECKNPAAPGLSGSLCRLPDGTTAEVARRLSSKTETNVARERVEIRGVDR
jgi:hypothetical protein